MSETATICHPCAAQSWTHQALHEMFTTAHQERDATQRDNVRFINSINALQAQVAAMRRVVDAARYFFRGTPINPPDWWISEGQSVRDALSSLPPEPPHAE